MAFQVSPGVQVKEIDLTNVVPAVSTSIGALAGDFNAGPIMEITTVSSETELVSIFGQPSLTNYKSFFQAASFLTYGNSLRVVRTANTGTLNAASVSGILIKNETDYDDNFSNEEAVASGVWAARAPGLIGNNIIVSTCAALSTDFDAWVYRGQFSSTPDTSEYAADRGGANDEMHIIIIDALGGITGTPGTILEKYEYVSAATDAKTPNGTSNYYKNVINDKSSYIYWLTDTGAITNPSLPSTTTFTFSVTPGESVETVSLTGGLDGTAASDAELILAMDLFDDAETVDVNLLITPVDTSGIVLAQNTIKICQSRLDLVGFISPPIADTVGSTAPAVDVIAFFDQLASTSYTVADSCAVKMYDKYNDVYVWVPVNGHTAGLCAYTDQVSDAWFSPAGFNRGQILNTVKISFNPNKTERDDLYKARVNSVVSFPGEGTVLYGDKTMLSRPSAFDRINVRRLFIVLEKAIATASKFQLFELNDEFTRAQFRNMVEPFLRDIKGRRGVTDFKVVCDGTNNTGQVIDTNNFVADIYIKPARSINFITLNFIATRTGVDFNEIAGQ
jgi:phage tail sheath protein FI